MDTQPKSIFEPIFPYVRTTHEADELLLHIDRILAELYKMQKEPFDKIAYATLDPQIGKVIQQTFQNAGLAWNNSEEIKSFFTKLKEEIKSFTVVAITLAFHPTETTINSLAAWIRTNYSPTSLLEINIDQNLIAGAVVVYKGGYIDLSARKLLDNYFKAHGKEILAGLK